MEQAFWSQIIQALKQYGPIIALFVLFIAWQARKIDQLLDRNSSIYDAEIKRLAEVQERLLTKILGPQPSSSTAPTIQEVRDKTAQAEGARKEKQ